MGGGEGRKGGGGGREGGGGVGNPPSRVQFGQAKIGLMSAGRGQRVRNRINTSVLSTFS